MKKSTSIHAVGTRKKAIARANLKPGTGKVFVNKRPLDSIHPKIAQLKIKEPLMVAEDVVSTLDIDISVRGGGPIGQADAIRNAIAKALSKHTGDKLKQKFLDYDRTLIIPDVRQREVRKPNTHGNARGKTQKSYR